MESNPLSIIDAVRIGESISLLCEKQVRAFKLDEVALLRLDCPVEANVIIAKLNQGSIPKWNRFFLFLICFLFRTMIKW